MKKKDFKTVANIHMISNLTFAIYCLFLMVIGMFLYKRNFIFLITAIAIAFLYLITVIFNIFATRRLKYIDFKGTAEEISKSAYKYSFWFFFPLIQCFVIQSLRQGMWDYYSQSQTKNMSKESEIAQFNIKLLDDLKEDGYISQYSYDKQKLRLEEGYKSLLRIEKTKDKVDKSNKDIEKLTPEERNKLKWE